MPRAKQVKRKNTAQEAATSTVKAPRCLVDSQKQLAAALGVSLSTLRGWTERGLDSRAGGKHCCVKAARWIVNWQLERLKAKSESRRPRAVFPVDEHGEPTGDGTVLDYKRQLEAKKLELQLLEAEKKVVSTDMVRDFLLLVANRLKDLGNTLQSTYGRDALLLLQEAVDDMSATVTRWEEGLKEPEIEL